MLEFEVSAKTLSGKMREFVVTAEKRAEAPPLLAKRGGHPLTHSRRPPGRGGACY